ncbi:MAG TPA: VOC family protein [Thermoleophilaceae bacterium]
MSERDGFQPGVPCWVAAVEPDAEAAAAFYGDLFGWETENLMSADRPGKYFRCRVRGRDVAGIVSEHGAPPPPAPMWSTYVQVESADDAARRAVDAGGTVIGEPFDSPGGARVAVLADPGGAVFCVWQPDGHAGAQLVNEPGAWSMSQLITPDPEGAKEFYGAVFGWTPNAFEFGGAELTLYSVDGYVGGEPGQPVARDVVAVMLPAEVAGDEGPPRWSVDFWVADADGTAAKAAELGGAVVTGPYDVPGFRQAVLADPQGAAFTVSQLVVTH